MPNKYLNYETLYLTSSSGKDKNVAIIRFGHESHFWSTNRHPWGTRFEEHRFNLETLDSFTSIMDRIESDASLVGLVITGRGKFFSNGLDIEFIKQNPNKAQEIQLCLESIMKRLLNLPMITVAAINGHCTATGAILSLCCDCRIMTDLGLFFVPAVDLGIVYSQGMIEVMKAKIKDPNLQRDMILLSRRYSSRDLLEYGVVSQVCSQDELIENSIEYIHKNWKKHGGSYGCVRARLYKNAIDMLSKTSDMGWDRFSKL